MMRTSRLEWTAIALLSLGVFSGPLPASLLAQPPPREKSGAGSTRNRDLYGDPLPPGARMRLGTVRYRQDSPIFRVVYTPDGRHFVTDGEDSILRVWDADTGRMVRRIDPDVGAMEDFALSLKGGLIMAIGITLEPGQGCVRHVTMTELGTGLVVDQGSWDVKDLGIQPLAICPDRRLFAVGSDGGIIRILDAWTGAEICRFEPHKGRIASIAFTRDGSRMAVEAKDDTGKDGHELRIYDVDARKELRVIRQNSWDFDDLSFSPDGRTIAATTGSDLHLWIVESGEHVPFWYARVKHISYSSDSRTVAGIGWLGRIGIFDLASHRPAFLFNTDCSSTGATALSPDDRILVANDGSRVLHSWEIKGRRDRFAMPEAHLDSVKSILSTPDGKMLITAGEDNTIRLWDTASGRQKRVLKQPDGVTMLALSKDGHRLVAPTRHFGKVWIWDLDGSGGPTVLSDHKGISGDLGWPLAVRLVDDDKTILLIANNGALHSWDIQERRSRVGAQLQFSAPDPPLEGFDTHLINSATFFAGGNKVLTNHIFSGLHANEVETGKELNRFTMDVHSPLTLSPDERILAVTKPWGETRIRRLGRVGKESSTTGINAYGTRGLIRLLDSNTAEEIREIDVPGSEVWALAFSPDGKTLAATSGQETGQIHLYEVSTGKEVRTIATPPLRSSALAFTPDGKRLITGMADASVLIWDVRPNP